LGLSSAHRTLEAALAKGRGIAERQIRIKIGIAGSHF
jgi:hypothetical protein